MELERMQPLELRTLLGNTCPAPLVAGLGVQLGIDNPVSDADLGVLKGWG